WKVGRVLRFFRGDLDLERLLARARVADRLALRVLETEVVTELARLRDCRARNFGAEAVTHAAHADAAPGPGVTRALVNPPLSDLAVCRELDVERYRRVRALLCHRFVAEALARFRARRLLAFAHARENFFDLRRRVLGLELQLGRERERPSELL